MALAVAAFPATRGRETVGFRAFRNRTPSKREALSRGSRIDVSVNANSRGLLLKPSNQKDLSGPAEPSIDEIRDHYDDWNERYRSGRFDEIEPEIRIRGERLLDMLRSEAKGTPKILEVGCGGIHGSILSQLASFN